MDMLPELVELNRIRLDEDKSYGELAAEIGLADQSTLHRLLKSPRVPLDRTLHKIRRFLDERRAAEAPKSKRRKRVA
jgi:DNA-binding Xre family transcriptional regulator